MMNNVKMINIKFMTDAAVATIKKNVNNAVSYMNNNKQNSTWISNIYDGKVFVEKTYQIPDFQLQLSSTGNYKDVDYDNSLMLYNSLKDLPRYILTDERFWAWINFEKCYEVALQAMPVKNRKSIVLDHYFFKGGNRRGLFFGVMSRCYFRVELTIDSRLNDYTITKYVIDNPQRFRELSWRAFSSQKHIVRGVLSAQKIAEDEFPNEFKSSYYPMIAKFVSRMGSVRILDQIDEEHYLEQVYNYIRQLIIQDRNEK